MSSKNRGAFLIDEILDTGAHLTTTAAPLASTVTDSFSVDILGEQLSGATKSPTLENRDQMVHQSQFYDGGGSELVDDRGAGNAAFQVPTFSQAMFCGVDDGSTSRSLLQHPFANFSTTVTHQGQMIMTPMNYFSPICDSRYHWLLPYFQQKSSHKRKGGQIRFSNEQTNELETKFDNQKYLSPNERKKIAKILHLSERQVKTWFQNRRAKWRRLRKDNEDEDLQCSSSGKMHNSFS
uniref:Homeobox domain-containing protein n=1 Tax=Romanomermis culicivorax TaxID=13658 RepID=A0A915HXN8_ROMCU